MTPIYRTRPSKLGRHIELCPGSYALEAKAEDLGLKDESEDATEGTFLHSRVDPALPLTDLTEEQAALVQKCRDYEAKHRPAGNQLVGWREQEIPFYRLNDGKPELLLEGTPDYYCHQLGSPDAVLFDYKFGRLELVDELIYWQAAAYAAMVIQRHGFKTVTVRVYSPRLNAERVQVFHKDDFVINGGIVNVLEGCTRNQTLRPSNAACKYCLAKTICPAFAAQAESMLPEVRKPMEAVGWKRALELRHMVNTILVPWARQVGDAVKKLDPELIDSLGYELITQTVKGHEVKGHTRTMLRRKGEE